MKEEKITLELSVGELFYLWAISQLYGSLNAISRVRLSASVIFGTVKSEMLTKATYSARLPEQVTTKLQDKIKYTSIFPSWANLEPGLYLAQNRSTGNKRHVLINNNGMFLLRKDTFDLVGITSERFNQYEMLEIVSTTSGILHNQKEV